MQACAEAHETPCKMSWLVPLVEVGAAAAVVAG
jgi:hypothetical protein